jgi:hypothetical protein
MQVLYVSVPIAPELVLAIHTRRDFVSHILTLEMAGAEENVFSLIDWVAYLTFNIGMPGIESVHVRTTTFLGIY